MSADRPVLPTYSLWVEGGDNDTRQPYPLRRLSEVTVISRLFELPDWAHVVSVTAENGGDRVFLAARLVGGSRRPPVFSVHQAPDGWRKILSASPVWATRVGDGAKKTAPPATRSEGTMPRSGCRYTVWVHDRNGEVQEPFPLKGLTGDEVIARLVDLPVWSDMVFVRENGSDEQVFLAFVDQLTSRREQRVALDILISPDPWRTAATGHSRPPTPEAGTDTPPGRAADTT